MEELSGHVPSLAPGMSQTIVAGEEYVVKDDNGGEVVFVGRDRPWVIDFVKAFDSYIDTSSKQGTDHPVAKRLAIELRETWDRMPTDLRTMLPKSVGIRL